MKAERGLFLELVERNFLPLPGSVIFDIAGRDLIAVALCQVMTQSNGIRGSGLRYPTDNHKSTDRQSYGTRSHGYDNRMRY